MTSENKHWLKPWHERKKKPLLTCLWHKQWKEVVSIISTTGDLQKWIQKLERQEFPVLFFIYFDFYLCFSGGAKPNAIVRPKCVVLIQSNRIHSVENWHTNTDLSGSISRGFFLSQFVIERCFHRGENGKMFTRPLSEGLVGVETGRTKERSLHHPNAWTTPRQLKNAPAELDRRRLLHFCWSQPNAVFSSAFVAFSISSSWNTILLDFIYVYLINHSNQHSWCRNQILLHVVNQ